MKNLANRISEISSKTLVKRSKVMNINDSLVKVLHNTNKKFTRIELCEIIAEMRLKAKFPNTELAEISDQEIEKTLKTVKNGLDTSISRSNNNSSFHYNEKYANMLLKENAKGEYYIEDAKKA